MLQDRIPPITVAQLTREDAFTIPAAQASYLCDTYTITCLALQHLPGTGTDCNMSFAKILQGLEEQFVQFLDRLQAALSQQVDNDEARAILLL